MDLSVVSNIEAGQSPLGVVLGAVINHMRPEKDGNAYRGNPVEVLTKRVEHLERVVAGLRGAERRAFWRVAGYAGGYAMFLWAMHTWGAFG